MGVAFEDEEAPLVGGGGEARGGGFVVFEHDGGVCYCVGFGGEETGRSVVGGLFGGWWGWGVCELGT